MSHGLFTADGKRQSQPPQAINFADQGWVVRIQDKDTLVAIHPAHAPIILTRQGEIFELEPDSDKEGVSTAFRMLAQIPEADDIVQLGQELADEFIAWCRKRRARITEVTGGESGAESPVTRQPDGEVS